MTPMGSALSSSEQSRGGSSPLPRGFFSRVLPPPVLPPRRRRRRRRASDSRGSTRIRGHPEITAPLVTTYNVLTLLLELLITVITGA